DVDPGDRGAVVGEVLDAVLEVRDLLLDDDLRVVVDDHDLRARGALDEQRARRRGGRRLVRQALAAPPLRRLAALGGARRALDRARGEVARPGGRAEALPAAVVHRGVEIV